MQIPCDDPEGDAEIQRSRYSVLQVKEIYSQDTEELHSQYPFITLDVKQGSAPDKKRGETHSAEDLTSSSSDLLTTEEDSSSPEELCDPQVSETFTTSRGNVYNTQSFRVQFEEEGEQGPTVAEVELVGYPQNLLVEVQRDIRVAFFTHLEDWYETALSNSVKIVVAKREELKSGLDLRLKLQESRAKRIEEDVHNVRAMELVLHRDHVDRHCRSIQESLSTVRTHVQKLQLQQQEQTENFRAQIYAMENVFTSATKSDKLASLCGSLQSRLEKHMAVVQKTQRSFRLEAESTLGGLREANAQFIKSLRLFSDGGHYTPHEIEVFQKRLEKAAKSIDSTDEAIMLDMEGTESRCLEQAKEVISMFEDKFLYLTLDLRFLEKIQRILTNTQVQIKTEATKSNWQKKHLDNMMMQLESMTEACARPGPEEKTVKVSDVSTLTWSIMEELKNRCQYLECSLDPSASVTRPESPLQGAFAVAARPKSRRQDKPTSPSNDSLLQPSRMGMPLTDDAAVGVVRGLLRISRPKATEEIHAVTPERGPARQWWLGNNVSGKRKLYLQFSILNFSGTQLSMVAAGRRQRAGGTPSTPALDRQRRRSAESVSSQSVLRLSKLTRSEKRFQVFGSTPEEQSTVGFNGFITNILWKANDLLLSVAEDFYKKKDRRPVTRPQHLQETFEQCAEDINRRLLIYQAQTREYHNGCLQDFKEQLSRSEELISRVPALLLSHLGEEHLQQLSQATSQIHQSLECAQQESEDRKKEHIGKLRVRLGHPAHEEELNSLRAAEEDRQKEQASAIQRSKQELQACARKHGEEFVTALAAATENLLFQMDNLLTVNEVQDGPETEKKKETLTALIRRKECKVPLQEKDCGSLIQRGSRTWPGVSYFEADGGEAAVRSCKDTASITTAKTTLGHLSTCEARDAVYQSYRQRYEEELTRAEEESEAHRKQVERWEQHWRESVKTLLQLYSE
ncbi:hypothetical protein AGOR_G00109420 [Albula goreensis]|uniref:DUF4456 domain-containing protein n=1 Tax=Albula goreensis TaxID=1534307 RepID=A0A8T3DK28_9TELE|nr:hypothetical protein AGOR_G00109420 [Albula goreensis]